MTDVDHTTAIQFDEGEIAFDPILRFFQYGHLPERLQGRSKPFAELARLLIDNLPPNEERGVALRKLLEAKDAAVRASVP